jgi:GT2 family glycosyltransferase
MSICIVSTDGREDLLRCLGAVFGHPPAGTFEVLVIDNASTDGTAAAVSARFGERVELIELPERRGKAENDSDLMNRARGRWCLLLNEDSELTPGAADALRTALAGAPRAAAAGARLVSPAGVPQPSAWRFPGVDTALASAVFAHRRLVVQSRGEQTREVDWVQSAGMLVRRAAFDQVGPLDPQFFVYSDEVDWQRRARVAGWSVLYVPAAVIMHREQLSADTGSTRRIVEFSRNRDTYMRKHHGRAAALAVRRYARHAYHSLFPSRGEGLRPR